MSGAEPALLVVDDNDDNRFTLTRRLAREGYKKVTSAVNGREALERLRADHFDLVLLDVMMPEMNGYQVLEQMHGDARMRDIPVIMISAVDQLESVVRCIELGADACAQPAARHAAARISAMVPRAADPRSCLHGAGARGGRRPL